MYIGRGSFFSRCCCCCSACQCYDSFSIPHIHANNSLSLSLSIKVWFHEDKLPSKAFEINGRKSNINFKIHQLYWSIRQNVELKMVAIWVFVSMYVFGVQCIVCIHNDLNVHQLDLLDSKSAAASNIAAPLKVAVMFKWSTHHT